jgi:hypothetical protein
VRGADDARRVVGADGLGEGAKERRSDPPPLPVGRYEKNVDLWVRAEHVWKKGAHDGAIVEGDARPVQERFIG